MIIEENTLQASASYEAHSLIWRSSIRKSLIRQQKLNHGGYGTGGAVKAWRQSSAKAEVSSRVLENKRWPRLLFHVNLVRKCWEN